jgi:hypothetical protein
MAGASRITAEDAQRALHKAAIWRGEVQITDLMDNLQWFRYAASWTAWRAFLCAVYGLPMTEEELAIFQRCTGLKDPPGKRVSEAWALCGRRARKSAVGALIGVYEGGFREHADRKHGGYLAPGEIARIPIIAAKKDDAGQIRAFAGAILSEPALSHLLAKGPQLAETIKLSCSVELQIVAASATAGRSRSIPCALYDEVAFWPAENSATPDEETMRAVGFGMANVPNPLTVGMSSLHARRGVLYQRFKDFYGVAGTSVLVWKSDTLSMHDSPTIRVFVEKKWADDPIAAAAEIGKDGDIAFRADVESFVSEDVLDKIIVKGRKEIPPDPKKPLRYWAGCDPSGGSQDSMCLAIAHHDKVTGKVVLDYSGEWRPPFDTTVVTAEVSAVLKRYGIKVVKGDHYGGEWPKDAFKKHDITYILSERPKREIYRDVLPLFNGGRVELLDIPRLRLQLVTLERYTARGGSDTVDHRRGAHDDIANCCALALLEADFLGSRRAHPQPEEKKDETTWDIFRRENREAWEAEQKRMNMKGPAKRRAAYRRARV